MNLQETDSSAQRIKMMRTITATVAAVMLETALHTSAKELTLIISEPGRPTGMMTTLTARECLDVLSEAADKLIEKGGV